MTGSAVRFTASGSPGHGSSAGVVRYGQGHPPALVISLDMVDVLLSVAPFPDGLVAMANFCRVLARESARLAAEIDPDGEPAPVERSGRHWISPALPGLSGPGH